MASRPDGSFADGEGPPRLPPARWSPPWPARSHSLSLDVARVTGPERRVAPARRASKRSHTPAAHILVPIAIFGGIAAFLGADLLSDYRDGHGSARSALEIGAGTLALIGMAFSCGTPGGSTESRTTWNAICAPRKPRPARRARRPSTPSRGSAPQSTASSQVEPDRRRAGRRPHAVEGSEPQGIATQRGTNEGTVRQQALAIYRKAGLSGRSSLSAFFLEGLVFPYRSDLPGVTTLAEGRGPGLGDSASPGRWSTSAVPRWVISAWRSACSSSSRLPGNG